MNKCLKRRTASRLLDSYPNVEVKRYNCASLLLPWRYSCRLHDKYLLGGRNISDRSLGAAANRRLRHAGLFSTLSHTSIHSWKRHSTLPRAHSRPSAYACCTTRAGRRTRLPQVWNMLHGLAREGNMQARICPRDRSRLLATALPDVTSDCRGATELPEGDAFRLESFALAPSRGTRGRGAPPSPIRTSSHRCSGR